MKKLFAIVAMLGLFVTTQVNAQDQDPEASQQMTVEQLKVKYGEIKEMSANVEVPVAVADSLKNQYEGAALDSVMAAQKEEIKKGYETELASLEQQLFANEAALKAVADSINKILLDSVEVAKLEPAAVEALKAELASNAAYLDFIASLKPVLTDEGGDAEVEEGGVHKNLKTKFIEGGPEFMALVSIALVIGLAFCIERIIYLSLAKVNAKKLMGAIAQALSKGDVEGAKAICRNTAGPVASICYQGLLRIDEGLDTVERSVVSYGSLQSSILEKGCSWITLFIAMAPSLGFLGTVIGMVMSFDEIQQKGDISPTIVAGGMKVALITTIYGIIVALVLQVFYNFILTKIESIVADMEDCSITLLDLLTKYNLKK